MKYYLTRDKKAEREASLTPLDRAILEKCKLGGMNITRLLKAGKPYRVGTKRLFATTKEIVASLEKLQKLGILEWR